MSLDLSGVRLVFRVGFGGGVSRLDLVRLELGSRARLDMWRLRGLSQYTRVGRWSWDTSTSRDDLSMVVLILTRDSSSDADDSSIEVEVLACV